MSLKCGIVGLPNVGKSTLFNALTQAGIAAENYPFCTIEPNTGVVEVPDPRLQQLAEIISPERIVPAIVEFVDIAGLVAGAAVAWTSVPGKTFYAFAQESVVETRKVVWPTRKETIQTTGIVAAFVVIMAVFLWIVDGSLVWLVRLMMGRE